MGGINRCGVALLRVEELMVVLMEVHVGVLGQVVEGDLRED
jgi:hypothetical protein